MKRTRPKIDLTRFLFRATGGEDLNSISEITVIDNLTTELDRLHALSELLSYAEADRVLPGTSELLRDIWDRAWTILSLWSETRGKKRARR